MPRLLEVPAVLQERAHPPACGQRADLVDRRPRAIAARTASLVPLPTRSPEDLI